MNAHDTAVIIRAYHDAWTTRDFPRAAALLADTLVVEVPVNHYPTAESFAAALASFGSMVTEVSLLAAMSDGNEAMLLYDLVAEPLGTLRVAEHFTVDDGRITRIRQIHDTMAVRAAGLAAEVPRYARQLTIRAPRERVFEAIGTLDGPATGGPRS
jgi:ketosteroid isomerase-like protein